MVRMVHFILCVLYFNLNKFKKKLNMQTLFFLIPFYLVLRGSTWIPDPEGSGICPLGVRIENCEGKNIVLYV